MKKLTAIFAFLLICTFSFAQSEAYKTAMSAALKSMNTAKSIPDLQLTANQFDRIASAEKKEWLPGYYAAFASVQMSFMEPEPAKRDLYLDKGQTYLDQILKLAPNESEIYVLQGFLYQARIQVSPMDRGQKYFMFSEEALGKAKALNPENPRAYYLSGQMKFYMPAAFGGGPVVALPLLTTAKQKFDTFKPTSELAPNWGLNSNQNLLKQCEEQKSSAKN